MDKLEKGAQKLQKLQVQLEKQYKKMSKLAKATKKEIPTIGDLKSAHLMLNDHFLKSTNVSRMNIKKVSFVTLLIIAFCMVMAYAVRRIKNNKMNFTDNTRFDVAYGDELSESIDEFDFEHASLEELEEALLRVENELNEVSAAIEKKQN